MKKTTTISDALCQDVLWREAKGQEAERLSGYVQAERFTKEKLNTMLSPHLSIRTGSGRAVVFGMNIRPATAKSGMLSIRWRRRNVRF